MEIFGWFIGYLILFEIFFFILRKEKFVIFYKRITKNIKNEKEDKNYALIPFLFSCIFLIVLSVVVKTIFKIPEEGFLSNLIFIFYFAVASASYLLMFYLPKNDPKKVFKIQSTSNK